MDDSAFAGHARMCSSPVQMALLYVWHLHLSLATFYRSHLQV